MGGPVFREVVGRMGKDGWLGIGWPREYGGQGRTPLEQFIFWDETYRARAPLPIIAVNTIGPTLMQFGTPEQKAELLPGIVKGELFFGVGYTEPGAGTDLASLTTRAVRDGDDYVIDGQKIFTTHAHDADYIWLAARTDPDAPKHKGISIILVPTERPGLLLHADPHARRRAHQRHLLRGRARAGREPGRARERGLVADHLAAQPRAHHARDARLSPTRMLDEVWDWAAKTSSPEGGRMLDEPWVQLNLARVYAKLDALKVLNWRSAWSITAGVPNMAEASAVKVMGTEFFVECYRLLLEIVEAVGHRAARRARRAVRRHPRARLPQRHHAHLRRRRERGAARHHRHGRPRPAAGAAIAEEPNEHEGKSSRSSSRPTSGSCRAPSRSRPTPSTRR